MSVNFEDYSIEVKNAIKEKAISFLYEAGDLVLTKVTKNYDSANRVDTGQTKGSFRRTVWDDDLAVHIGSNYENAIWEEFGTGIHAEHGDGRKTPWKYYSRRKGRWFTTSGKKGHRPFQKAYNSTKDKIIKQAERMFSDL